MLFLVGFCAKPKLCPYSALVFWHILILILLTGCHKGESQEAGFSETVVALVGDDVILPCHLEPAVDAVSKSLEWSRPDLKPRFVHVWHDGQNLLENQNPSYNGRTSVSTEKLKRGDLSLSLTAVKHSDNGIYRCYFPSQDKEFTVELVAGSFSPPLITRVSKDSNGVVLQCEAKGWYPEPEVLWQDDKGKVLTAGPKEMTKGPDDLFTVRSKVTLQKSNDEIFTCRVHQRTINQTRETHIQISADFFETSSSAAYISIIVVILLGVIVAAAFIFWKRRQNPKKVNQDEEENKNQLIQDKQKIEELEGKNRTLEEALQKKEEKLQETLKDKRTLEEELQKDLEEKKKTLEEELQKKKKEEKNLKQMVPKLMEFSKELHGQTDLLQQQKEDMEKNVDDIEEKYKSAEKTAESDKALGFLEMKTAAFTAKKCLRRKAQEDVQLHSKALQLQNRTDELLEMMKERNMAAESDRERIFDELEKSQKKLSGHR